MRLVTKLTLAFLGIAVSILGVGGWLLVGSTQDAFEQSFEERVSGIERGVQQRLTGVGAELERAEDVLLGAVARDDDDRRRAPGHDEAQEAEAVHLGHLEIERDEVGLERSDEAERFLPVGCLAHHRHALDGGDDLPDELPVERRVVHDEHAKRPAHRAPSSAGRR